MQSERKIFTAEQNKDHMIVACVGEESYIVTFLLAINKSMNFLLFYKFLVAHHTKTNSLLFFLLLAGPCRDSGGRR
jgi:hypothetical protein